MALRSSWEGFLKLNLLSVPVKAYSATVGGRGRIGFNQIHAECGSRIKHKKVCPIHGEVTSDQIVPGYQYAKNQYVIVEPGELEKLRGEDEKAITIDVFIPPGALDPVYHSGRSYYLAPDGKVGQKPYAVLQRVMRDQDRHAVALVVFAGRKQVALIRPVEGLLVMTLLNFDEQVKKPAAFRDEAPEIELSAKEVELAESLVRSETEDEFDFSKYHDDYETELAELIEAKAKGKKIVSPQRHGEEPAVINLMDALRKSLDQVKRDGKKHRPRRPAARRKTG